MDYQNGRYGYNTSPNRGADTFSPFSDMQPIYDAVVAAGVTPASDSVEDIVAAIAKIDKKHRVTANWRFMGDSGGYVYGYSILVDGVTVDSGSYTPTTSWSGMV